MEIKILERAKTTSEKNSLTKHRKIKELGGEQEERKWCKSLGICFGIIMSLARL